MVPGAGLQVRREIMQSLISGDSTAQAPRQPFAVDSSETMAGGPEQTRIVVQPQEFTAAVEAQLVAELDEVDRQKTGCCKIICCALPALFLGLCGCLCGCFFDLCGACCNEGVSFTRSCTRDAVGCIFPSKKQQKMEIISQYRREYIISHDKEAKLLLPKQPQE